MTGGGPMPVRKDRSFYRSLHLHAAILRHLEKDPERVIALGLAGVERIRDALGGGAHPLLDEWRTVLERRDVEVIRELATSDDEHATDMRHVAVFLGVLSTTEREGILNQLNADIDERRLQME